MRLLIQLLFILHLAASPFLSNTDAKPPLSITIRGLHDTEHDIYVAVSRSSPGFPNLMDIAAAFVIKPAGKNEVEQILTNLPYAKYSIVVFQDLNGNKKLDKNFLGIPSEPFAFSNNYHPVFHGPKWEDCAFDYNEKSYKVVINKLLKM